MLQENHLQYIDGFAHPSCNLFTQEQFSKLQVLFVVTSWEMISILELAVDEGEQLILINPVEGWDVGKVDVIQDPGLGYPSNPSELWRVSPQDSWCLQRGLKRLHQ